MWGSITLPVKLDTVSNDSPPLSRFFGAALPTRLVTEISPAIWYTFQRNTASVMKNRFFCFKNKEIILRNRRTTYKFWKQTWVKNVDLFPKSKPQKQQFAFRLLSCLSNDDRLVRESGCLALGRMKSKLAIKKLVYLW